MNYELPFLHHYLQRIVATQRDAKSAARRGETGRAHEALTSLIRHREKIPTATNPEAIEVHAAINRRLDALKRLRFLLKCSTMARRLEWDNRRDVPPLYRESDRARLPDVTAFDWALSCVTEANGLTLWGATGAGKSRALFAAGRRTALNEWSSVAIVSPAQIKRASLKPADWTQMLSDLLAHDVLLVDDLSHARFSEAYAGALLELIEAATSGQGPRLFVTVQCTGRELVRKWCGNDHDLQPTAEAIARRLGPEFATCIEFTRRQLPPAGG